MRSTLILLFSVLLHLSINAQSRVNEKIQEVGLYYKFSSIASFNSDSYSFSPGNSLGLSYDFKNTNRALGFEFNLEFLGQNVYGKRFYNEAQDSFKYQRIHFSCIEASYKLLMRYPFKKFAIYFNPGINLGTYQKVKRQRYYYTEGAKKAYLIETINPNIYDTEGFALGVSLSFGCDFNITDKMKLAIDYTSCLKSQVSFFSEFSYRSRGLCLGLRFDIDN